MSSMSLFFMVAFLISSSIASVTIVENISSVPPFAKLTVTNGLKVTVVIDPAGPQLITIVAPNAQLASLIRAQIRNESSPSADEHLSESTLPTWEMGLTVSAILPVNAADFQITVNAVNLNYLVVTQSSTIHVIQGQLTDFFVVFHLSGGSSIFAPVKAEGLLARVNNTGTVTIPAGEATGSIFLFNGAALYNARNFKTTSVELQGSGSLNALVNAKEAIFGTINGSAMVSFVGNPIKAIQINGFLQYVQN